MDLDLDIEGLRSVTLELLTEHIKVYADDKDRIWFLVLGHFDSLPKSDSVAKRCKKDIETVPEEILDKLIVDGLLPNLDFAKDWVPPTQEEVREYSLAKGYIIDAKEFIDYYEYQAQQLGKSGWYDGKGKQVKDWKAKLRKVWFRNAQKAQAAANAPQGMEFFSVKDDKGQIFYATKWVNGKPMSNKGIAIDLLLQQKFNELKTKS